MQTRTAALLALAGLALASAASFAQDKAPAKPLDPNTKQLEPGVTHTPPKLSNARMTFESTELNLGVISDDKNVNGEYKFKNTGTDTLVITSTTGSCGCTVPALTKKEYLPGEEGAIKVEYHPANRRGPQHTTVTVNSNDSAASVIRLDLKSDVRPMVMVDPQMVSIGQLAKGKGGTFKATVTSRIPGLTLLSATPTLSTISAKILPGAEADLSGEKVMQFPVEITVPPEAPVGAVTANIAIRTSDTARNLNLTVTGEVLGEIVANPPRLQIGSLAPGAPFTAEVRLTSRTGKPFRIAKIDEASGTATKAFSNIAFAEAADGKGGYVVTVSGTASQNPGSIRGDLVVSTDIPGEDNLKFGYFGFIRAQPKPPSAWDAEPSLLVPGK